MIFKSIYFSLDELSGNTNGYRYYRLLGISGTTKDTNYIDEFEFKIADA
jgi:hypothetical protein